MSCLKSRLKLLALASALLLAPLAHALEISGGSAEDQATLKAIADKWVADYLAGDIDGLMSVMHEDGMILSEKQPTVVGTDAIRSYFETRAGKPGVSFQDDIQEIRINGSWAFVRGDFLLEVAPWEEGKPGFKRKGRYFVLYEKNAAGEWKMLRDIDNDAPMD
jgi:ketosteroid isomerase-like protein